MKIRQIGDNPYGVTGYSNNVRELFYELNKIKDVDAKVIYPKTNEYIPPKAANIVTDQIDVDADTHVIGRAYVYNQFLRPFHDVCRSLSAILVLEGDKLPEDWVAVANALDIVWTASEYGRNQFISNGIVPEIVRILPHGFDPQIFHPTITSKKLFPEFTFCFVGGFATPNDRKGADLLVKAFTEEFTNNEKVRLLMKINTTYNREFNSKQYLNEIGQYDRRLTILDNDMSQEQLVDVYNASDIHVMPTYGEAFSMNLCESMACGKTAITTNFSGHLDYCRPEFSYLIDVEKFVLAHYGVYDVMSGSKWAQPSIKHLRELMRYAFDNQNEVEKKGRQAQRFVLDNYTWRHAAFKCYRYLKEIENGGFQKA